MLRDRSHVAFRVLDRGNAIERAARNRNEGRRERGTKRGADGDREERRLTALAATAHDTTPVTNMSAAKCILTVDTYVDQQ